MGQGAERKRARGRGERKTREEVVKGTETR